MKLTKTVPARTVSFEASSCKLDFMEMNQRFRDIRSKSRNPMDKCSWCNHKFVDGEMMALAISNKGNKVLCQTCGQKLLESGKCSLMAPIKISLSLFEAVDPLMTPPWNGMSFDGSPITIDEVRDADPVSLPLGGEDDWGISQLNEREDHCGRIRWLMENGWTDPIEINLTNRIWPIEDGNHRLAAALLRGDESILATVTGGSEVEVAKFLSGESQLKTL